jgi:hypothetical protein
MLELTEALDFVWLFLIAAALGGVGGLVFELLQRRYGQTGLVEMAGRGRGRYRDWGVWANVVIGAVAALAALWVFPPQTETIVVAGETTTTTKYDIIDLVGLSLIIGSAGSSFLSSLQAKALAQLKSQEAAVTRQVATSQLEAIGGEVGELKDKQRNLTGDDAENEFKAVEGQLQVAEAALTATATTSTPDFQ